MVATQLGQTGTHVTRIHSAFIVLLFVSAEVLVVHVKFRNDSHTFSMAEAVLVLGMLSTSHSALLTAQLVGGGLAMAAHRRQRPIKLVFNVAHQALGASLGLILAHFVLGDGNTLGPRAWLASALLVVVSSLVSLLAVSVVLWIATGSISVKDQLLATLFGVANALAAASIGVICVLLMAQRPLAAILIAVPTASVLSTNLAYVSQRDKHRRLEFLYGATKQLTQAAQLDHGLVDVLEGTRSTMRADWVGLVHVAGDGDTDSRHIATLVDPGGAPLVMVHLDAAELGAGWAELLVAGDARRQTPPVFLTRPITEVIVAPLEGETRRLGLLLIGRSESSVNQFNDGDRRTAETLASHLAITIENGRLEQSLTKLRELERVLGYRASHDTLTDLANRALFTERVLQGHADPEQRIGVMFIDLDDFKTVNDTLGHAAGDRLLQETAERLRDTVGGLGMPARLGGDEFAVLLEGEVTAASARQLADHILEAFKPPLDLEGREARIKATIGIALEQSADNGDGLLRNADIAMYVAKAAGKGCHRLFHTQMHDVVMHRQDLVERLEGAHDRGEIVIHYQPIVDLATGRPRGAEALVRWNHPVHGLLSPDAFVNLAEQTGRIVDITHHVLEAACFEAASWDERPHAPAGAYISVNVTPQDLADPHLIGAVQRSLSQSGLAPQRLLIEVTESAFANEVVVTRTLNKLRELGVRIAVDDFGTGYSSLARLRSLPLDVVKIAEPLITNVDRGGQDLDFARLLADLTRVLGVDAIAEGVERAGQARALHHLGFTAAQGYYYARPAPSAEVWSSWRLGPDGRHLGRDRRGAQARRAADFTVVTDLPVVNELKVVTDDTEATGS